MPELVGDVVQPSEFIVPTNDSTNTKSGALFVSGATLCYISGATVWTINATEL